MSGLPVRPVGSSSLSHKPGQLIAVQTDNEQLEGAKYIQESKSSWQTIVICTHLLASICLKVITAAQVIPIIGDVWPAAAIASSLLVAGHQTVCAVACAAALQLALHIMHMQCTTLAQYFTQ